MLDDGTEQDMILRHPVGARHVVEEEDVPSDGHSTSSGKLM